MICGGSKAYARIRGKALALRWLRLAAYRVEGGRVSKLGQPGSPLKPFLWFWLVLKGPFCTLQVFLWCSRNKPIIDPKF